MVVGAALCCVSFPDRVAAGKATADVVARKQSTATSSLDWDERVAGACRVRQDSPATFPGLRFRCRTPFSRSGLRQLSRDRRRPWRPQNDNDANFGAGLAQQPPFFTEPAVAVVPPLLFPPVSPSSRRVTCRSLHALVATSHPRCA